jgi:hypothetical protein
VNEAKKLSSMTSKLSMDDVLSAVINEKSIHLTPDYVSLTLNVLGKAGSVYMEFECNY